MLESTLVKQFGNALFKSNITTYLFLTIALAPIWWILGFSFFIYHVISAFLFIGLFLILKRNNISIRIPKICLFLILLILVYTFSLILNIVRADTTRIIASLYNYSFWLMGLFLIIFVYNVFKFDDIINVLKLFNFILLVTGIILVCGLIAWFSGIRSISFRSPTLLGFEFLESFPLIKASTTTTLVSTRWLFSWVFPRSSIMNPYPTATGAMVIMLLPLSIAYNKINWKKSIFKKYVTYILGILILLFSLSRFSIFSLVIAFMVVWLINSKKRIFFYLLLFFSVLILIPYFELFFGLVNNIRPGSLVLRFESYIIAINNVMQKENFMFGIGIKPRLDELLIPIGSHSTYLGLFLRTGIIGILIFIFFQLYLLFFWFKNSKKIISRKIKVIWDNIGVSLIAMSLWMIFEDLDAPQLVCFLYCLVIGIMFSIYKNIPTFNKIAY